MKFTPVHSSLLLAGILVIVGGGIYLGRKKSGPEPAQPPARRSTVADDRETKLATGRKFTSADQPEFLAFLETLANLAASDPAQAVAQLAAFRGPDLDPDLLSLALAAVARGWAETDPMAAAHWVSGLQVASERLDAAVALIPKWAETAPEDCLAWVSQGPLGEFREASLVELAEAWGEGNPQAAFARFYALGSEDGVERGLQNVLSQWVLSAPAAAVDHLASLPDLARRDELLQVALAALSTENPHLTWQYCDRFTDPETAEQTRGMALEALAEARPQEAIALAATAGNSETLLAGIVRGWFSSDPAATRAWIASQPDPEQVAALLDLLAE